MLQPNHILYITYNGLHSHLGRSQILPYIRELQKQGNIFTILSYEKEKIDGKLNINHLKKWKALTYSHQFGIFSKIYDLAYGLLWGVAYCYKEKDLRIIHCRSYLPTLIGLIIKAILFFRPIKVVFDMRGFLPDEYADIGHWNKGGFLYTFVKMIEKKLLYFSDHIVVLTYAGKNYLEEKHLLKNISTIPCCVDESRLKKDACGPLIDKYKRREDLFSKHFGIPSLTSRKILLYIGSVGTWYPLDKMIEFYKVIKSERENSLFFLLLVNDDLEKVVGLLTEAGISKDDFKVMNVGNEEIMAYIQACDYGIAFIKNIFSKIASSPIKNGEFIAGKLPLICNDIGDNRYLISPEIGHVIQDFIKEEYLKGFEILKAINPDSKQFSNAREILLQKHLSLAEGVKRYEQIYRAITHEC